MFLRMIRSKNQRKNFIYSWKIKKLMSSIWWDRFTCISIAVYYTLMSAELNTNLSRFEWIRFWLQKDTMKYKDIYEYYQNIRSEWFGEEAKRRILQWTFLLSSSNYEWYYLKVLKVKQKMFQDLVYIKNNILFHYHWYFIYFKFNISSFKKWYKLIFKKKHKKT